MSADVKMSLPNKSINDDGDGHSQYISKLIQSGTVAGLGLLLLKYSASAMPMVYDCLDRLQSEASTWVKIVIRGCPPLLLSNSYYPLLSMMLRFLFLLLIAIT